MFYVCSSLLFPSPGRIWELGDDSFWWHLTEPGRGTLGSECHKFSYQLPCDWFHVHLGYRSLLTDFWISCNRNWSMYYWIVILVWEERYGVSCSCYYPKRTIFARFFKFIFVQEMLSIFFSMLCGIQILYYFFYSNWRLLFMHLFC